MRSSGYAYAVPLLCVIGCTTGEAGRREAIGTTAVDTTSRDSTDPVKDFASAQIDDGRRTFRFDTFGDEAFWGDTLQLHLAIAGEANEGVGPGVSPRTALAVGLKVDVDALPVSLRDALAQGQVNLDDPATTLALLQLGAVVGVTGVFDAAGTFRTMGIQCALCHSTVDDSFAPGIGHRLDGWPNRDLDVGTIVSLAPDLSAIASLLGVDQATVRAVITQWGPGRFDAELFLDGKALGPDGKPHPTLIPPAFGLGGVNLHTWTGWGGVSHWNAFVANLEMHGQGTFFDPRLDDAVRFPIAAANHFGHVSTPPSKDRITPHLAALQLYQLALAPPRPPAGSFDTAAAARGKALFRGKARCASCHVPPLFTEPGWNMHTAEEIGIDSFQCDRAPDQRFRTSPLRGLFTHLKGGLYHDGRYATLADVVAHYNAALALGLTGGEPSDLVEYLKSL
jgi:mono/diheme cytochrome c family protein